MRDRIYAHPVAHLPSKSDDGILRGAIVEWHPRSVQEPTNPRQRVVSTRWGCLRFALILMIYQNDFELLLLMIRNQKFKYYHHYIIANIKVINSITIINNAIYA